MTFKAMSRFRLWAVLPITGRECEDSPALKQMLRTYELNERDSP
jgi:hypothetical protein